MESQARTLEQPRSGEPARGLDALQAKRTAGAIQTWIVQNLEDALELEPGELQVDEPFDRYGLDSTEAVNLISSLEDWLGCELSPNLVYRYPTISALSAYLEAELLGTSPPQ